MKTIKKTYLINLKPQNIEKEKKILTLRKSNVFLFVNKSMNFLALPAKNFYYPTKGYLKYLDNK